MVSHPDHDGGTVVFAIAANPGAARTGIIIIEGNTVTVNQAAVGSLLALQRGPEAGSFRLIASEPPSLNTNRTPSVRASSRNFRSSH